MAHSLGAIDAAKAAMENLRHSFLMPGAESICDIMKEFAAAEVDPNSHVCNFDHSS
jgi:hypothetical protein